MHTTLVSTEELSAELDGSWVIVDCRFDLKDTAWGRAQYRDAHIPGAAYASLDDDLSGPVTGHGGRHPLPSPAAMAQTFGHLGIGSHVQVVAYDQDVGTYASRLWWMLRYMGHGAVAVLDGGWAKWVAEQRATRSGDERRASATFQGTPRVQMHVEAADVQAHLHEHSRLLVDARSPERFAGAQESLDRVAGHIPGALNHFYKRNVKDDNTMLPPEQLRKQFDALLGGLTASDVVMYCGSGVTACHNLLSMEVAGLGGAKLYSGSWSDWSSDANRPLESGNS